ncbi:class II fumarate hydratase [Clostridium cellulovorans]|uniref:Fumarate hydratase class II n=1 Tax=Clostridium cellulovorans (strain ATCC 35296 / DSM 3052 / OCM 3 / 743B) TaxID=573061 RepID=D9SQA5_CLOC7|nr:class II fumarate hydratase [Clostridium cellulovorans]ADL50172.1 fumarate hydratase, class II [Clostridium cellulovorans 743B]
MDYRIERDSMGEIKVPSDKYWGAQTQRSFENFKVGSEIMPLDQIKAIAIVKKAAAIVNHKIGKLDQEKAEAIKAAADEIIEGKLDDNFPLVVWQTGSGTQTNMNVNEVIANRANEILGAKIIHPNDHVNMSQSSNDVYPTAMHIAAVMSLEETLIPEINALIDTFLELEEVNKGIIKTGRTHLQDATPISFSQEISGWRTMLQMSVEMIKNTLPFLKELAIGGTAVGTGLNSHKDYASTMALEISKLTGKEFSADNNKFHGLSSKDAMVFAHGALKALAANAMKIANDVRWMAGGPRCGLNEIYIPENEPGSSIMPGKVNPTQCESLTMVSCQVMGNDMTIGMAASQGNFELNVFMPVIIYNFLQSVSLLSSGISSFNSKCAVGITVNKEKMKEYVDKSLMLATALNPKIGYDNAAKVVKTAFKEGITLKEAAIKLEILTEEEYDQIIKPENMV